MEKEKSRVTSRLISQGQKDRIDNIISAAEKLEKSIIENCKDNTRRENALTKLEECVMWANKSISHEID